MRSCVPTWQRPSGHGGEAEGSGSFWSLPHPTSTWTFPESVQPPEDRQGQTSLVPSIPQGIEGDNFIWLLTENNGNRRLPPPRVQYQPGKKRVIS